MKILHIVSQSIMSKGKEVTGSDVFVSTLSNKQVAEGHEVFIAGDLPIDGTSATFIQTPIGKRRPHNRLLNVLAIKRIIKRHKIELVHAHSRASSWVARHASLATDVAFISTIHGRQKIHLSTKLFDIYGDRIVAVCENIRQHLMNELGFSKNRIEIIPNAINFDKFVVTRTHKKPEGTPFVISIIGRTTGEKGNKFCQLCENVFPFLLERHPNLEIRQIGGSPDRFSDEFKPLWDAFVKKYPDKVVFTGHQQDLRQQLSEADLVIGAGRVALEATFAGVPVFPFGEACRHDLLTSENFQNAIASNFGDVLPCSQKAPVDFAAFRNELDQFISKPIPFDEKLKAMVVSKYGLQGVYEQIINLYQRIIFKKRYAKQIPVLMYHKIPNEPPRSKHRTWVTAANFENHLRWLSRLGYQSLTMLDLKKVIDGTASLSDLPKKPIVITLDDGYVDNCTNAVPLLKKYGFSAIIFCLGDFSIHDNCWDASDDEEVAPLMTADQLKELAYSGIEIAAHTLSHVHLPQVSKEDAWEEIFQSKKNLEAALGREVVSFAYPYGEYNDEVVEMVKQAGFTFGFATSTGAPSFFDDSFRIFRTHIFPKDSMFQFLKKISSWYRSYFLFKHGQ